MRKPIKPQSPTYRRDRDTNDIDRRLRDLESFTTDVYDLSGSVDSRIEGLSGSLDAAIRTLTSGGLSSVSHDSSLGGDGTSGSPLSASPTFLSLQAGVSASVATLSGTVDARFKNWNYSNLGITGSVTVTQDLRVSGSLTGSGDTRFERNVLVLGQLFMSGGFNLPGNLTVGTNSSNAHNLTGQTEFLGATWSSYLNRNTTNQPAYIRAGQNAGGVFIGDVNTGGVSLGNPSNRTTVQGPSTIVGSLTGSGDAAFSGDVDVAGTFTAGTLDLGSGSLTVGGAVTGSAFVLYDGDPDNSPVPVRFFLGRQTFTSSGPYVPTAGTKAILVRMVGGGGGGGGGQGGGAAAVGGGGASGAYWEKYFSTVTSTSGSVIIGSAGSAGSTSGGDGGTGGDTAFAINSVTYVAKGGLGGSGMANTAGSKMVMGGNYQNGTSAGDATSQSAGTPGVYSAGSYYYSGAGGSNPLGGGGNPRSSFEVPATGWVANGYGGGGGGGAAEASGMAGGAGTAGIVIIDEFG